MLKAVTSLAIFGALTYLNNLKTSSDLKTSSEKTAQVIA